MLRNKTDTHLKLPLIYEYFHENDSRVDAVSFTTNDMNAILRRRVYFTVYGHTKYLYILDAR